MKARNNIQKKEIKLRTINAIAIIVAVLLFFAPC